MIIGARSIVFYGVLIYNLYRFNMRLYECRSDPLPHIMAAGRFSVFLRIRMGYLLIIYAGIQLCWGSFSISCLSLLRSLSVLLYFDIYSKGKKPSTISLYAYLFLSGLDV